MCISFDAIVAHGPISCYSSFLICTTWEVIAQTKENAPTNEREVIQLSIQYARRIACRINNSRRSRWWFCLNSIMDLIRTTDILHLNVPRHSFLATST